MSTALRNTLNIRSLVVSPPLALAPMVGLSHSATRSLLVELGGVGLFYTEMLAAKRIPHDNEQVSPMLVRSEIERPLIYQIFLSDEDHIAAAVTKLQAIGADGIDINLGCPAPQLRRRGAGGFLAEDRVLVSRIVTTIRKATDLPVTAKIRLGQELNRDKLVDFCHMLEADGIDMLTVHGRLHGEKFCRPPRWDWIALVKSAVKIPVIANGSIYTVDDAWKCLDITGADGLMIGRGAMERPWLFADIRAALYGIPKTRPFADRHALFFRFVELLEERFRPERRLGRLKQFSQYFARSYSFGHQLASLVQTSRTIDDAVLRATDFFAETEVEESYY